MVLPGLAAAADLSPAAPHEGDGSPRFTQWWDYSWNCRRPITIDTSQNSKALNNYPVLLNLSFQDLITGGKLKADMSDMRLADSDGVTQLSFWPESTGNVWVKIPSLLAKSTKVIYLYYNNPAATSAADGTKVFDMFDDFGGNSLDGSKWTQVNGGSPSFSNGLMTMPANGINPGKFNAKAAPMSDWYIMRARFKVTGGVSTDERIGLSVKSGSDGRGYNYVMRDLTNCNQISFLDDNVAWYTRYANWAMNTWYVEDIYHDGTYVQARLDDGQWQSQALSSRSGYLALNFGSYDGVSVWDWALVRYYQPPDPTATMGAEELSFKFVTFTFSPSRMNTGDPVFFNVTFNNPAPDPIKVQLAARDADDFNNTTEYFFQEEVTLAPGVDSTFPFTWTAVGGPHTIWLAVFGYPFASAKVKVNRDPVIAPVKDQSLWQDKAFVLQVNATDPDGDKLDWSIDNLFFNISPVSNRSAEITVVPTNDDIGIHRANITVRDPMDRSDTRRVNFTVNNVNDPPVLTKIPNLAATQYKELRYQATATDPDTRWGDVLTYTDNTDLFDIDPRSGEFVFTPVEEQVGKHNVKVTVTDAAGASQASSFTITVSNVNDPPVLEMLPPQFATQGKLFQLKIVAVDPDLASDPAEKLTYSDDSTLFNINNGSGLISFTPTNDQLGTWRSNITVMDRGGLTASAPLNITVMNANDPPSIDAIPPQTATEGVAFSYQCTAIDPDLRWGQDNLTFSDDTDIFNIDPKTGAISFTPTGAQAGIKRITVTVKDEKGLSASASFDLTVVHVNHPPSDVAIKYPLDGARLKEADAMYLDGTAKDSDKGDVLEYTWYDNDAPAGIGKNISVKLSPGSHTIRLEVSDGTEAVSSSSISVTVEKEQASAPVTSGGFDWIPIVAAAIAVVAAVGVIAVVAARRRKRPQEPGMGEGRVDAVPEGEDVALPPVPPAEAGGDEARALINSTLDRLAEYQEAHPDEVVDMAPVMEKVDIAREMLGTGANDDALDFAKEASLEAENIMAPKAQEAPPAQTAPSAPKKVTVKKKVSKGKGQ